MRVLLVFNPEACSGRAARMLPAIEQALAARGVATETFLTRYAGHAMAHLASCTLSAFDGVLAVGGDGTLFEVVNGLYRRDRAERIPLGVIPLGTGNAFARELGLQPGDWQSAVNIIAAARKKAVDVGRVQTPSEQFYFLNIIGMGFVVDASLTARKLKRLGRGAYTLAALWQVLNLKSYPVRLEIDGRIIEQDNVFVEISNTKYTGTDVPYRPRSQHGRWFAGRDPVTQTPAPALAAACFPPSTAGAMWSLKKSAYSRPEHSHPGAGRLPHGLRW